MNEPSTLAVFGTFFAVIGLFVGLFAFLLTRKAPPPGEGEPEEPSPREDLLPLSDATRDALGALRFAPLGDRFWGLDAPEPGTEESIAYTIPGADDLLHEVWIGPDDLEPRYQTEGALPRREFELWVVPDGGDTSELGDDLAPPGTVPGATVELTHRVAGDGATRFLPGTPEDFAACAQFIDADVMAQLRALPGGTLEVNVRTPTEYEIWVRWPEQDERSGARVGDAVTLLRAVVSKLR